MNSLQTATSKLFFGTRLWRLQGLLIVGSSRQRAERRRAEQYSSERDESMLRNNRCSTSSKSGGSCRKLAGAHLSAASPKVTNDELQKMRQESRSGLYPPGSVLCPAELAWQRRCLNATPVGGRAGSGVRPDVSPLTSRNASSRAEAPGERTRRGQSSHLSSANPTNPVNPSSPRQPHPIPEAPALPPASSSLPFHLRPFFFSHLG